MYDMLGTMAKILITIGAIMISVGIAFYMSQRWPWVGRLPGDIYIEKKGAHIFLPFTTCIVISAIIAALFLLIGRL